MPIGETKPEGNADRDADARVAILLCTKDGEAFLPEQLQSFADQTHQNWTLIASDDGSTDGTRDLLARFAKGRSLPIVVRDGPGRGACANFVALASDPTIDADYFAFSDQDDVWYPDKLRRALSWLATIPSAVPALYCGRTELMSVNGRSYGLSPLFARPFGFPNALIQSIAGGNTMVFNRATKSLFEAAGPLPVVSHDWWAYQLVSGAGGMVRYDPRPAVKYRQHADNLVGANVGWGPRTARLWMMWSGRFSRWNETNIAALSRVAENLLCPENRATVEEFARARSGPLLRRLRCLIRSGVYRQTVLGNIGLVAATILRRI
jgi:hypothetical protein